MDKQLLRGILEACNFTETSRTAYELRVFPSFERTQFLQGLFFDELESPSSMMRALDPAASRNPFAKTIVIEYTLLP